MSEIKQSYITPEELAKRLGTTQLQLISWGYKALLVSKLQKLGLKSKIEFIVKPGTVEFPP